MRKLRFAFLMLAMVSLVVGLAWMGCQKEQQVAGPDNTTLSSTQQSDNNYADMRDIVASYPQAVQQVIKVQDANTADLMALPGVVGTGTGLDENGNVCIKVYTALESQGITATPKIAASIQGVPVVVEETGEFRALALTGTYRPVPIGVSVGNDNECASGTIGCVVVKNSVRYILSNNHVLARQNAAKIGEKIDQPGRYDTRCRASGQVATLSDFQPISFTSNNTMDAAIAAYVAGIANTCSTPSGYYGFPGTTVVAPSVNLKVMKVGRTSSRTTGTISAINVTIRVGYSGGTATFVGQFQTTKGFSKSGDSGSLIVTNDGANNPVGLLFAGTNTGVTIGNPIGPVLQKFGVSICSN